MKMKEGTGWKACYNEEKGVYGAEVMFQGSWNLYEISGSVFNSLSKNTDSAEAERLIKTGRSCIHTSTTAAVLHPPLFLRMITPSIVHGWARASLS